MPHSNVLFGMFCNKRKLRFNLLKFSAKLNIVKTSASALFALFAILQTLPANAAPKGLNYIRVLVDKVDSEETQSFTVNGQALGSSQGHIFRSREIICEHKVSVASQLLSLENIGEIPRNVQWTCSATPHTWNLKSSISLKDRSGFVQYKNNWYRGQLELLQGRKYLFIINHVPVDDYIASLIHGEMPETYNIEALKAQAVSARSYAVAQALKRRRQNLPWDVKDSDRDQVYPGAQRETRASLTASIETKDEYLLSQGEILKAYYSAASGGHSELPSTVWGRHDEDIHYIAKPNTWDKGRYKWNIDLSTGIGALWQSLGKLIDIHVIDRSPGARALKLKLYGSKREIDLSTLAFVRKLGMGSFKSLKFDIDKTPTGFTFKGEGWGHGVGLSQVAAQKMALAGNGYKKILAFHYPKAELKNLNRVKLKKAPHLRFPPHAR